MALQALHWLQEETALLAFMGTAGRSCACFEARNQLFIGPAGVPYYKMPLKRHYFNAIQHGPPASTTFICVSLQLLATSWLHALACTSM
eukprot:1448740-Amphidinium_carterae.1